jgi:uracil-DNA glycosylase
MAIDPLTRHHQRLAACRRCPAMAGTPVYGQPVRSAIILIGQAPGAKEATLQRPFAWTAGKTLFGWFSTIGVPEDRFRQSIYMAAMCRCFPGKNPHGGDRVPSRAEVSNCSAWLEAELRILAPKLVIPVGKLAIGRFVAVDKLDAVIGRCHRLKVEGRLTDVIPLPHPSGASVWHRVEPGKALLARALGLIAEHPAWRAVVSTPAR